MSLYAPEQLEAAHKANLATLFAWTNHAVDGFQKLSELNLQAFKSSLAESQQNSQKALAGTDLREWFALPAGAAQPTTEKALAYGRQVYDIAASTQAELAKTLQAHFEEVRRNAQALVEDLVRHAPAGTEAATAALQSVLAAGNGTLAAVQKVATDAANAAKANFEAVATRVQTGAMKPAARGGKG